MVHHRIGGMLLPLSMAGTVWISSPEAPVAGLGIALRLDSTVSIFLTRFAGSRGCPLPKTMIPWVDSISPVDLRTIHVEGTLVRRGNRDDMAHGDIYRGILAPQPTELQY